MPTSFPTSLPALPSIPSVSGVDPLVVWLITIAAGALVAVLLLRSIAGRWREASYARQRRLDMRQRTEKMQREQEEVERLNDRILATSSTGTIAGFEIIRQIEAVFVEGQPTPAAAVAYVKAAAVRKGANAVVNLNATRLPSGKCVANGDAVIVRVIEK